MDQGERDYYYGRNYDYDDDEDEISHLTQQSESLPHEEDEVSSDVPPRSWSSFAEQIDSFKVPGKDCNEDIKAMDERSFNNVYQIRKIALNNKQLIDIQEESTRTSHEQQLMANNRHLNDLLLFSEELLSNLRVAVDRRAVDLRRINKTELTKLLKDLENESVEANAKYENIIDHWSKLNSLDEPFIIWEKLQEQQGALNETMRSKDELIELCEIEVQRISNQYTIDVMRQTNILACLMERADNQIEIVKRAYNRHIEILEKTIEAEFQLYAINANKKWRSFFDSMNISIINRTDVIKYFDQFFRNEATRIEHNQLVLTNATRIRLHKDTEQLRLDLLAVKHQLALNTQIKFNNYQILKKRRIENKLILNQQKRKLWRQYDQVIILKEKIADHKRKVACKKRKLSKDICRLHSLISFLETHWFELNMVSKHKFDTIWDINYNELMASGKIIIKVDQLLHKYPLFMSYSGPTFDRVNINHVYKYDKIFKRKHQLTQTSKEFHGVPKSQMRLIRNILRKLTDRSDFLIEDCLFNLIEPLEAKNNFLVRLDTIFAALHIESIDEVVELIEVFKTYAYCPNCRSARERETSIEILYQEVEKYKDLSMLSVFPMGLEEAIKLRRATYKPHRKRIDADKKLNAKCPNHYLIMEPTLVRLAMAIYCIKRNTPLYDPTKHMDTFIQMQENEMNEFWKSFHDIIAESKFKSWKLIEYYLNQYYEVLKLRKKYDADVINLRRHVTELHQMVKVYEVEF